MALPKLIILTGPQGSGNHLFSKLFALHPDVRGWDELVDADWIGHRDEPFHNFWRNPELMNHASTFWIHGVTGSDYFVTSISIPYQYEGKMYEPNFPEFTRYASKIFDIQFAIIGRDKNILENQQRRVRGEITLGGVYRHLEWVMANFPTTFISMELLQLYKDNYIRNLSKTLGIPIVDRDNRVSDIMKDDANKKYITSPTTGPYDSAAKEASGI
jgi:hypothetical protein